MPCSSKPGNVLTALPLKFHVQQAQQRFDDVLVSLLLFHPFGLTLVHRLLSNQSILSRASLFLFHRVLFILHAARISAPCRTPVHRLPEYYWHTLSCRLITLFIRNVSDIALSIWYLARIWNHQRSRWRLQHQRMPSHERLTVNKSFILLDWLLIALSTDYMLQFFLDIQHNNNPFYLTKNDISGSCKIGPSVSGSDLYLSTIPDFHTRAVYHRWLVCLCQEFTHTWQQLEWFTTLFFARQHLTHSLQTYRLHASRAGKWRGNYHKTFPEKEKM